MAGVDLLHVPYKGAAPAVNDLLGGQVNIMFADVAALLPHIKSGKLKALGIGATKRFEGLPEVPTIAESGVPGFEAGGFLGLVAPAGTARPVIDKIQREIVKMYADPVIAGKLEKSGISAVSSTPEEFDAFFRKEAVRWEKAFKESGIKLD